MFRRTSAAVSTSAASMARCTAARRFARSRSKRSSASRESPVAARARRTRSSPAPTRCAGARCRRGRARRPASPPRRCAPSPACAGAARSPDRSNSRSRLASIRADEGVEDVGLARARRRRPPRPPATSRRRTPRAATKTACSCGPSRSKLQSMVARRVRCRSGRSTGPPPSTSSRSPRRPSRVAGGSSRTRAAASSMASGSPSSRRQISATTAALRVVQGEAGGDGGGALGEELLRRRLGQRREQVLPLGPQPHRLPAGRHHDGGRDRLQERRDVRAGGHHLLEVVQHEQRRFVAERRPHDVEGLDAGLPMGAEGVGDRAEHERGVGDRAQRHEDHPAGERLGHRPGRLDREPGLADAAGADHGDQPRPRRRSAARPARRRRRPCPAARPWERAAPAGGAASAAAGSCVGSPAMSSWYRARRLREVLEPVLAEGAQRRAGRQVLAGQGGGRLRHAAPDRRRRPPRSGPRGARRGRGSRRRRRWPRRCAAPIRTSTGIPSGHDWAASDRCASAAAASACSAVGKAAKKESPWVSTSRPPHAANAARSSRRWSASAVP